MGERSEVQRIKCRGRCGPVTHVIGCESEGQSFGKKVSVFPCLLSLSSPFKVEECLHRCIPIKDVPVPNSTLPASNELGTGSFHFALLLTQTGPSCRTEQN